MGEQYGGDHQDFRGGEFNGDFTAKKVEYHQHGPAPTALDALPPKVAGFTGRGDQLAELLGAFDPVGGEAPGAVLVAAVSGLGGIGKTALAVEAAHEACDEGWFPGGVLFVNLHGYDDDRVTAEQALETLLRGLGTPPEHIPNGVDARAALYRSVLAARERELGAVLVLADNASAAEQVRPLHPGGVRHRLLATSRSKLPQLGARLLPLGELSPEEAYDLLDRALRIAAPGDTRVANEGEAAAELALLCGHLPLALQIAAALLVLDRDKPVAELVVELAESGDRLLHLDDGERSVRAAFDLSYQRLPAEQARLLRLLALAPGSEVTAEVVAALDGADVPPVRVLDALCRAHLVERGSGRGRWRLHDLVRVFGVGVVKGDVRLWEEGEGARERLLAFYCRWAGAADGRLRWLPGMQEPERFTDRAGALAWLDSERAGLVAVVQWAREERFAATAVLLSQCLAEYLDWRRSFDDKITVCGVAREAAHRAGDRVGEASAWNSLGIALQQTGRVGESVDAHTRARDLFQAIGDLPREAAAWSNLGSALQEAGRTDDAIDAHIRARDLFQAAGDRPREAMAWGNLGLALREAGRAEDAIAAHIRSRDLYQAAGDRHGEARGWNNLGGALWEAGRRNEAVEACEKALEGFREFEDWYGTGRTLSNLALAHQDAARPAEARTHFLQSADAYTRANALTEAAEARTWAEEITP
ncbi:tetratricopeptide repeat protein [Streptomyces prunicolor]|uniref:Tetratricopeptide repeat protein n=2 Tax=Streptomyces prunicolor TaxID=67348 RepID=A0ABU4FAL5_9ACTN|nr:tetratricopeptide repeat protein [Streptomyces prunicolor]MDV7217632.1 tetratricopeptide repeat protein [Streptomyces prunicolor]